MGVKSGWAFAAVPGCRRWSDDRTSTAGGGDCAEKDGELEQPVESNGWLTEAPLGPVVNRVRSIATMEDMRELFRAHHYRRHYLLRSAEARIEMAVEQVTITCATPVKHGPGLLRFDELVLSLKEGTEASLAELANYLTRTLELVPARMSSFERGLQTAGLRPPTPEEPPLTQHDLAIRLAYRHLEKQFQELRAEEPLAWEGLDPEGVHQMRVNTRRLRAAFRSFESVLPTRASASFNAGFRWLARVLGAVRDLDVQRANLEQQLLKMPPEDVACLHDYRRYLADEWRRSRRQLLACLESVRYRRLIERFTAFLRAVQPTSARATRKKSRWGWGQFDLSICS